MNKISVLAEEYAASAPAPRGKWYARIKPVNVEGTIEAVEELLDHEPTEEDFAELEAKWLSDNIKWKQQSIIGYAKSDTVKSFLVNEVPVWIDSETRSSLVARVNANKAAKASSLIIYLGGTPYTLTNEVAAQMLAEVELYSGNCFCATESQKAYVATLTDVDEVINYDYTPYFPEKLSFTF